MAKGSVRKKGKKWYYRFYVEDASGNLVQKECVGTESKSGTEKLLRQAMDDYEKKKFVAKAENLTVGQLLDVWAEEELKTGTLSNGTVENYLGTIRNIKKHPLAERKLKNVTSEHLQSFFDLLSFGGVHPDGKERKGYSKDYIHSFSAVMQQSFRFAVFPKQYITFNPMQYIKLRYQTDEVDLFSDEDMDGNVQPISREDYERLLAYLQKKNPAAILPIQIAYYAGLRIGEACGLAWQDVNLEEQCLTIRRSIRYDGSKRKYIIGPTKRKKVRIVDFGDTLVEIFRNTRKEQLKNRMQYGELYHTLWFKLVVQREMQGECFLVNFADDFVAGFQYKSEAERYYKELKERMEKFGLELESSKSRLIEFGRFAEQNRRARGECKPETFDFLGFTFYCSKTRKGGFVPKVQTSRKKFEQKVRAYKNWIYDNRNRPMREIIKELNAKLIGHYRYYGVTWNFRKITTFLHRVQQFLFKAMNRRGCRRAYTWNGFVEMLKYYPLAKPKTYYCLY